MRKVKASTIPREATMHRAAYMVMSTRLGSIRIMVWSLGGRSPTQYTLPQRSRYKVRVTPLYSPMHCSRIEGSSSLPLLSAEIDRYLMLYHHSVYTSYRHQKLSPIIKFISGISRSPTAYSSFYGYAPIMTFDAQQSRIMEWNGKRNKHSTVAGRSKQVRLVLPGTSPMHLNG